MIEQRQILIIDDNDPVRAIVDRTLSIQGFGVIEASTGELGIELARARLPHVILCDLNLGGGLSGYEVLREIRADPKTSSIPVILMALDFDEPALRDAGLFGTVSYLPKPFSLEELIAAINKALSPI